MTDAWSYEREESGSGKVIWCGMYLYGQVIACGQQINGQTIKCGQVLALWNEETEAVATEG